MLEENNDTLALSAALRQALAHGELSTAYQPQLDLASGKLAGFEVLARWLSPQHGWISTRAVHRRRRGRRHDRGARRLGPEPGVHRRRRDSNASSVSGCGSRSTSHRTSCAGAAWLDEVLAALAGAGLEPSQLEVEITEGVLIDDHGGAVELLDRIRRLGVTIVVDDFGRGYSSLAYLTRFPVDKLKIDRSFIREIASDDADAAIVDAIIVMSHALGLTVVAEGVETVEQERYLRARGCDEVQGFLYSPGVPRPTSYRPSRPSAARSSAGFEPGVPPPSAPRPGAQRTRTRGRRRRGARISRAAPGRDVTTGGAQPVERRALPTLRSPRAGSRRSPR